MRITHHPALARLWKTMMSEYANAPDGAAGAGDDVVVVASDHAGYALKEEIKTWLQGWGHKVLDLGPDGDASVDYPDFAVALAVAMGEGRASRGVLVCGSGIGISIAANRFSHIRAAPCRDGLTARLARQHNDANVLALGSRLIGIETAKDCLEQFLTTAFEGGRHAGRVAKLSRQPCFDAD